jgi:hypothetical protein
MDDLATKLGAIKWRYADQDAAAKAELARRIGAKGRKLGLVTYSDLVRGVTFRLPNVNNGVPFQIDTDEWTGLHRAILGDFLGAISADSYREAGFLATALVVNKLEYTPSDQFFKWMEELGVLPDLREDTVLAFWAQQVNKAHNWYRRNETPGDRVTGP